MNFKFRPLLIPTIFTIPALIVLLGLGSWQVQRLNQKEALIAKIEEKSSLPAVNMPGNITDLEKWQYRKIKLSGRFIHDKEVHLYTGPKVMHGRPGYNIFTPLLLKNGSFVWVDRGWVPSEVKEASARPSTLVKGDVDIIGMLHSSETPGSFTPENMVDKNMWFWIDIPSMSKNSSIKTPDYYVRLIRKTGDTTFPVGGDVEIRHRNDHLQYAITWYSLAIILLVIYVLYHRKVQNIKS
ncbi:SURF1 family protein [Rickettsiales bacterium]|nr:SURF1 family protein [Rickettsiales bacterium]